MTKETAIEIIAQYDGCVIDTDKSEEGDIWYKKLYGHDFFLSLSAWHIEKYATSLDWLHPVAMRVVDELNVLKFTIEKTGSSIYYMTANLLSRCGNKPVNGEYIDLLIMTAKCIEFLNQQKSNDAGN